MCAFYFRRWAAALVVALPVLVGPLGTGVARAGLMLGAGWTETPTKGYEMNLDGKLDSVGAYQAQPLKQIVPNWNTLAPVTTLFAQGNSNDNNIFQYFTLRMEITNKTNAPWIGFHFLIIDNNDTSSPPVGGGNLLHPDRAHFHIQSFDQGIGFTGGQVIDPAKNYDLTTSRGVYDFVVEGGFTVKPGDTWSPMLLGIHAPQVKDDQGDVITSFTIVETPIVAPEPASLTLLGVGSLGLLGYGWRRRKQVIA